MPDELTRWRAGKKKQSTTSSTFNVGRLAMRELPDWAGRMVLLRHRQGLQMFDVIEPIRAVMMRVIDDAAHVLELKVRLLEVEQEKSFSPKVAQLIDVHKSYISEIKALKDKF